MANWVNVRLLVSGLPTDVERFRRAAGARRGRLATSDSSIFTAEMEFGEGGDLEADGVTPLQGRFRTATYRFQGRNDDHVDHFEVVSRRFPTLALLLVHSDPNGDEHGSYLLCAGRRQSWMVPARSRETILPRHMQQAGVTDEDDPNLFWVENEAFDEMMDVAEQHWQAAGLKWLTRSRAAPPPTRPRRGGR